MRIVSASVCGRVTRVCARGPRLPPPLSAIADQHHSPRAVPPTPALLAVPSSSTSDSENSPSLSPVTSPRAAPPRRASLKPKVHVTKWRNFVGPRRRDQTPRGSSSSVSSSVSLFDFVPAPSSYIYPQAHVVYEAPEACFCQHTHKY